ncbi:MULTISPECIES: potassium channel protein [Archaeoglobus]|uniref:Potassium channel, putative n=3 Tax=Archaeoglobus fulgidus TaxID=2234 RepID=O28600_ARCFU|nr:MULTISPECIES: potassium channel protein [Archaeoglobus]AAB89577.1 potassium channel, putative [Archaeoglobus fulgidus DSM 4304]AIG98673.1 K+ transport system, NAD-binding protein component [Archaeoglobus fulgidus DSM 8774]KUJ93473.1 MAG: Potassium channel, putative [Archaeoglobus fulgidus]KUK05512.1 MAG: Potassium channel, putative [Archaeoglobus fulgidus]MDI3497970.1 voltage-gated potassium channel [Archaeoglobus sp.]
MSSTSTPFLKIGIFLSLVVLAGTVGYHFVEGWDWFDSLYMTVITITTTGYGEVKPMGPGGRVISMLLMFVGVGTFLYAVNVFMGLIVEGRIEKRWEKMIEKMEDHFILCGYGLMGREIIKELPKDKVVVIDSDIGKVSAAREDGYVAVHGDATDDFTLEKAGIGKAKALICCMSDASNAFAILTAKELNPRIKTVAILRSPDAEKKMRRVGVDILLSPYRDAAKKIISLLSEKAVAEFVETVISGAKSLNLEKVVADEYMDGKTLRELDLRRRTGCIVVAVVRRGDVILPEADTRLEKGDILYILCSGEAPLEL